MRLSCRERCRRTSILIFSTFIQTLQVSAQSQSTDPNSPPPHFEVVSIQAHQPGYWPTFEKMQFTTDGLNWTNALPQAMITYAYDLRDPKLQVSLIPGAPKWIRSEWFDIRAKLSDSDQEKVSKMKQAERDVYQRELVKSLLAERFKLECHLVSKETPGYELVVMRGGPKNMKQAAPGGREDIETIDNGDLRYSGTPLSALLLILPQMLEDRPVIDKTGLTGRYDFELKWARDASSWLPTGANGVPEAPLDGSRPSIFKALEEELGLKLVPTKMPRKGVVIDHIEKPSPN